MKRLVLSVRWALSLGFLLSSPLFAQSAHPEWDGDKVIKSKLCAVCHGKDKIGNQHAVWKKGPHANAFKSLGTQKAKEIASKAGVSDPQTSGKCLKCHSTAYGFTEARVTELIEPEEGVTCQSCHGPGKNYKTKHAKAKDDQARAALGLVKATEANSCSRCHNPGNPTADPTRYKLPDGTSKDFDFKQALEKIAHPLKK